MALCYLNVTAHAEVSKLKSDSSLLTASMQNATEELQRLEHAFESVKRQLFGRLHDIARAQLFQQAPQLAPSPQERLMLTAGQQGNGSGGSSSLNGAPELQDRREGQTVE